MPKERDLPSGSDPDKEPFVTIDDLLLKAEELTSGLRTLSEYKYPLDVRRGVGKREGVSEMPDDADSRTVKAGSKTYFLDIKKTRGNKPYLLITESRFKGEGEERERVSISIFPENAEEFSEAVSTMTAKLE